MSPSDNLHRIAKRSVLLAGHRTSVSLEQAFWNQLKRFAAQDGCSVNALVARIDAGREGNLSSALRVYVLARLVAGACRSGAPAGAEEQDQLR